MRNKMRQIWARRIALMEHGDWRKGCKQTQRCGYGVWRANWKSQHGRVVEMIGNPPVLVHIKRVTKMDFIKAVRVHKPHQHGRGDAHL